MNKTGVNGWTALHLAAMEGNLAIVQALTTAGADLGRKGQAVVVAVAFLQQRSPKERRGLIDGGVGVWDVLGNQ